ncbi:MAG: YbaK/EbsC family protein [Candidatus Sulfotelmatobacter sp.]
MPAKKLREFLDSQAIPYMTISHAVAYTAKEIAALTHISNKELAKTVIVKIDSTLAMAVLPASYVVDLSSLRSATGTKSVTLAKESEFKDRFPECEIGAMPPFGNLSLPKIKILHSMPAPTTSCSKSATRTSHGWSSRRS